MSPELLTTTFITGVFGATALGLALRRRAARAHAEAVEARIGARLDDWERVLVRGLLRLSVGGHWREREAGACREVVAYRALLSNDAVGWQRWLLVQITAPSARRWTLARATWPSPIWALDEDRIQRWQLGFAKRSGVLGPVEATRVEDQELLCSPALELGERERAALSELADARSLWVHEGRVCAAWVGDAALPSSEQLDRRLAALADLLA